MKRLCVLVLFLLCALHGLAQTCTTATCTATSTSEAAFLAALPSTGNTNATVVVNIPAGTSSWTSDLSYTIPSAVTTLTIQGASTVTFTGTAGTSSYAYTTVDNTIIRDADSSNNSLIAIATGSSSTHFRMTGLTLQETTGATKFSGDISITGNSQNFRFDHNHIGGTGKQDEWMRVEGHVIGVIDHNVGDENPNNTNGDNYFQAFDPVDDTVGLGDGSWRNGPLFGTLNALYIESNYIKGGAADDCNFGGRFVVRFNTLDSNYVPIQTHGTKSAGGPQRGCIGYEAYNNYFTGSISTPSFGASGAKGGTGLLFNNTVANGYNVFYAASTDRNGGDNADETNNPNGWGYCGTSTPVPSTGVANGTGSNWDGNSPSSSGYPCLDGLGRGQDTQALNGQAFPSRLNSSTGTVAWPHQYLEPIYMWNNSLASASYVSVSTNASNNQDYYYDQTAQSGSFTGAAGTGHGLLSARPSTCTPGAGGTFKTSPTGSYGVAYFATDANSGQGELYVCTGTNTWTGIYQPAVMPHPLVSSLISTSMSLVSSNSSPAAGATITLTATLTPSSGPTGTITYYDGGVSIGTSTLPTLTHTVTSITTGTHTYTATYSGDGSYSTSTSAPITVTAGSLTSTSTSLSASNTTPTAGATITLTATVTPSSGPTGTVTFYDGGSSIGTGTLSSGTATHTVTGITAGTHTYTATYGGDSSYASSASSPVTVTATGTTSGPGAAITTGTAVATGAAVQ